MAYEMRRTKQALNEKEIAKILKHASNGVFALAPQNADDYPYAVPVSFVYMNDAIYFHCAMMGHKVDAITANPRASFCVVAQDNVVPDLFATDYRSVIAFGTLRLIEDAEERLAAFRALGHKYARGLKEQAEHEIKSDGPRALIYRLDIEHITGKMASDPVRKRGQELQVTPAVRKSMQGNKRANTKPELLVRQRINDAGLSGYRLQWKVPGRPDIAWPGKKVALFVNGCFWHRCPHCKPSMPSKNVQYWTIKFEKNQERDEQSKAQLEEMGWTVHVIWECQLKKKTIDDTMAQLLPQLAAELGKELK